MMECRTKSFSFMDLPPELRIMVWMDAAELGYRRNLEVTQKKDRSSTERAALLVAQSCREARQLVCREWRDPPVPPWAYTDPDRDSLLISGSFSSRCLSQLKTILPHMKNIVLMPPCQDTFNTFARIFPHGLPVKRGGIALRSVSFVQAEFRVNNLIQEKVQAALASQFPLVLDLDNIDEVGRIDHIYRQTFEGTPVFSLMYVRELSKSSSRNGEPLDFDWTDVQQAHTDDIRVRLLPGLGTPRFDLVTPTSQPKLKLPTVKRVVILHTFQAHEERGRWIPLLDPGDLNRFPDPRLLRRSRPKFEAAPLNT
ncbi:hypothetical protein GGS20DRAFT_338945 [Poronia punctata]|nr:hypothetical protein GGS20DRAFT_338945 [Poronia punctata]